MSENPNRGSSFEDFLKEEGILEASTTTAVKRVLAWQIEEAMRTQHLTKSAMAARMHTSRSQLERLLDPEKTGVSLETIQRAAAVVDRSALADQFPFCNTTPFSAYEKPTVVYRRS